MKNISALMVLFLTLFSHQTMAQFISIPTPATESIIGIDSYGDKLTVAVGNQGQILHFNNDIASLVASGINDDLFSVQVINPDFALASGVNFVLMWDGATWNTLVDLSAGKDPSFITPVWSAENSPIVYYQILDTTGGFSTFHFICPYDLTNPNGGGFCKAHSSAILEFCGTAGDIKALQTNGSILRFTQGTLANLDDPMDGAVFEQPIQDSLNLIAAFIPEEACLAGNFAPSEIFAINRFGDDSQFYHFDGQQWTQMGTAGTDQLLTGIDGANRSEVTAVGRAPDTVQGAPFTVGVAWHWDGNNWSEETLPADTLGLTDVTIEISTADIIFPNGFENLSNLLMTQGVQKDDRLPPISRKSRRRAMSECSATLNCKSTKTLADDISEEFPFADLKLDKTLVNPIPPLSDANPVAVGDHITYALRVTNLGPDMVNSAILNDIYFSSQLSFISSDCPASVTDQGTRMTLSFGLANLGPGQFITCRPIFEVLAIPVQQSGAVGVLNGAEVYGNLFDPDLSNNKDACLIDSNEENQPANRVQCDPEQIWFLL